MDMVRTGNGVVNWTTFDQTRALIGNEFTKILGYYRDDAAKCVVAVEQAYKLRDAVSMVRPAHTLKGDSLQFGGEALGKLAEHIEHSARRCVEEHSAPDKLDDEILQLRPLLIETLSHFERELTKSAVAPPLRRAAGGFGRKAG